MIVDEKYRVLYGCETMGSLGTHGVKIMVAVNRRLTEADELAGMRLGDQVMEALVGETVRLDPKEQERKKEERKMIFDLFPETIYMQELPNGYCSKSCCSQRPWYRVTTVRGHIKIGWRKRVIEIDWTESDIKARAEELFPNEKVTKMDRGIHAWSYEDARRYLRYILGAE